VSHVLSGGARRGDVPIGCVLLCAYEELRKSIFFGKFRSTYYVLRFFRENSEPRTKGTSGVRGCECCSRPTGTRGLL
jgi:hypothetical protein